MKHSEIPPPAYGLVRNLLNRAQDSSAGTESEVVIYMDDYRKVPAMKIAAHRRYDEDLLCANGNTPIRVFAMSCYQNDRDLTPELPEDFSKIDADVFLNRVYALATQV